MRRFCTCLIAVALLSACSSHRDDGDADPSFREAGTSRSDHSSSGTPSAALPQARIIVPARPIQCVVYARDNSAFTIRGDAWTWWNTAEDHYVKDERPAVGSVLVLKRSQRLRYGHLAVVSQVVSSREILVDHANWLNRGQIHRDTLVLDVSQQNDWSLVRVWYTPGNTLGQRSYPAHGFIHPTDERHFRLRRPPMRGPDVRSLQEALIRKGFRLVPDGIYGTTTQSAVLAFQQRMGLPADGVVGPQTRRSLGL